MRKILTLSGNKFLDLIIRFSGVVALAMSLFHLYSGYFGQPEAMIFRSSFLAFVLVLCFLSNPLGGIFWKGKFDFLFIINCLFVLLPISFQFYIIRDIQGWYIKFGHLNDFDMAMQIMFIILILEATRRAIGWPMVGVAIFFLINARFANYMPGVFYGPPMNWDAIVAFVCMQESGIFGSPVNVIASIVVLFIIFSSLLRETGFIDVFLKLAYGIAGAQVGGPAKAAVVASAIMGTISGSSVANVAVTGSFTIPLMKKLGYKPYYAGAIEAVASAGGQLMPPVMGATAFIMAEFLGVPYLKICMYAIIPAILYFSSIFLNIHFRSLKRGITGIKRSKLPSVSKTLKQGGHLLFTIVILLYFLIQGYSIQMAIMWTIIATFLMSMIKKDTRLTPQSLLNALQNGAKAIVPVGVACACAGIIICSLLISGTAWRISHFLLAIGGDNLWVVLIISMIICIVLGMGMTTVAVYLITASTIIPLLVKLGVVAPAAHLFGFYFGVLSTITPPVALSSFTAAGIAGANINQTGFEGFKVGIAGFVIPFLFIRYPEMLFIGEIKLFKMLLLYTVMFSVILFLNSATEQWFYRKLQFYERIILITLVIFVFVLDIRNPIFAFLFFLLFGFLVFLQKTFSYNEKLDSWFFAVSKLLYNKSYRDKQLADIQKIKVETEKLEKIDFGENIDISEKKNINWLGWLVWVCILFILYILAKINFVIYHFGYFLLILLFISFLATTAIEFLNKKDID